MAGTGGRAPGDSGHETFEGQVFQWELKEWSLHHLAPKLFFNCDQRHLPWL